MRSFVQVLTTPTADTPGTAILLNFDHKRYLFGNVSEGTQRAATERGGKLAKVWDIFLTGQVRWSTTGGLVGMILTLADVTKTAELAQRASREAKAAKQQAAGKDAKKDTTSNSEQGGDTTLTIHGGRNLTHLLATGRRYILRKGLPVRVNEIEEGEIHDSGSSIPTGVNGFSTSEAPNGRDNEASSKARDVSKPTWSDENIKVWAMVTSPEDPPRGSSPSSPRRTRKRSYHEIERETSSELAKERKAKDDQIRKSIISEMFDSNWNLDTLIEMPLSEVNLPATIFVKDPLTRLLKKYKGPLPRNGSDEHSGAPLPDIQVLVRKPWPAALRAFLPPTSPSQQSLSYIVKNHPRRGAFLPERALALKVEKGYKWGLLSKGSSVTASDGKTVTPDMVLTEGREGGGIAIVELPSRAHVKRLINRAEWRTKEIMDGVGAIIWILGPGVSQDDNLLGFVQEMSHLKHLISSPDRCPNHLAFDSAAAQTIRLNEIDPIRFPVPTYDDRSALMSRRRSSGNTRKSRAAFELLQRGMVIDLQPKFQVQRDSAAPLLDIAAVRRDTPKDAVQLGIEAREMLERDETIKQIDTSQRDLPGKDAEIITLGTGSMMPSKYRNVSATLLRVPGYGSYLFDCGENTLGQLRRVFPEQELKEVLRDLKVIWISHMHADHQLGTTSVIKAWYEEVWGEGYSAEKGLQSKRGSPEELAEMLREGKKLFVVSDYVMLKWLEEYSGVEDYGYDKLVLISITPVDPGKGISPMGMTWKMLKVGSDTWAETLSEALMASTGVSSIQAVRVSHCQGAYAVSFTFSDGFKFSYSGDCRPSKAFAEIGKGTTVLVHEATFDDELHIDAVAKKHSTTSEALAVGMAMGARRIILTHFSQRYQKIPVMDKVEGSEIQLDVDEEEGEENGGSVEGEVEEGTTMPIEDLDVAPTTAAPPPPGIPTRTKTATTTATDKDGNPAVLKIRAGGDDNQDMRVGVAFDYMRVKVGEISHLAYFTPALLKLFEKKEAGDVGDDD